MTRDESPRGSLRPAASVVAVLASLLVLGPAGARDGDLRHDGVIDAGETCDDGSTVAK